MTQRPQAPRNPFSESDAMWARLLDDPETQGWFERERIRSEGIARLLASPDGRNPGDQNSAGC